MSFCFECKVPGNFSCKCSGNFIFMCNLHHKDHISHSQFKFKYSKDLALSKNKLIENLVSIKNELKLQEYLVSSSEERLINKIKEMFIATRNQLEKADSDISKAIEFSKSLTINCEYNYNLILKHLINQTEFDFSFLIQIKDSSKDLERKLKSPIKIINRASILLSQSNYESFDDEVLKYEISMSMLRESMLINSLNSHNDTQHFIKSIVGNNMNKRQYNRHEYKSNQKLEEYEKYLNKYTKKIHRFTLVDFEINDENYLILNEILMSLEYIEYLDLRRSIISDFYFANLLPAIRNKKAIKHIIMKENLVFDKNLDALLSSFQGYAERMRTINIGLNFFSSNGCKILNLYLPSFLNLRDLDISNNDIGVLGAELLQPGLSKLLNLEDLNIKSNSLKPQGIQLIMQAIASLPRFSVLNISNNEGLDEGTLIISSYLKSMKILMIIFVDFMISQETVNILVDNSSPYLKIVKSDGSKNKVVIKKPDFAEWI